MGPSVATKIIIESKLKSNFQLIHLDTSDHRSLKTLNVIDIQNIYLAVKHYILLILYIIKYNPKIVYIPISQTTIGYLRDSIFILISKLFNRKVVCHLRGGNFRNWLSKSNWFINKFVKAVHSLVDGQIVLGDCLIKLFSDIIETDKIYVIPNGRDFINIFNDYRIHNKKIVNLLFLSNFIPSKGILDVIYSLQYIKELNVEFNCTLAGSWRDNETKKIVENFIQQNKQFRISVIDSPIGGEKYTILTNADIFLMPTYYESEGHPWVIVEAMAAGLPIISTDQGAITESVIDGINGFIVEKRNPKQIAEKIELLMNNKQLRISMGNESRKIYVKNFTEEKLVENFTNCFNSI